MIYRVKASDIGGEVVIPGSKSHTIRALTLGLLAEGESVIGSPLESSDTLSCLEMVRQLGGEVKEEENAWRIQGRGTELPPPSDVIDVGNSGTSLYVGLGVAGLIRGATVFTGDHQIRNRPSEGLLASLNDLGAEAFSTRGNGKPPVVVRGPLKGGKTSIKAVTSQYLSALLIAAPGAEGTSIIDVPLLNEKPYVTMTLDWLERSGITLENDNYRRFTVPGRQKYKTFDAHVPADFSSATFFFAAAALTGAELTLRGLDFSDSQGDKEVVDILEKMGAEVEKGERHITIRGKSLRGGTFDLNAIPDALPALAVVACFAEGETRLVNVAQARLKETDRISVMAAELKKCGADIEEMPDGLVIRKSSLTGTRVSGHHDHRIVMSLAVAALASEGEMEIDTAEAVSVTFPGFRAMMESIGAGILEEK